MSIKDKMKSLVGNFEEETILNEEDLSDQGPASLLASGSLKKEQQEYQKTIERFENKVNEINELHRDREKKINENVAYLISEKKKLENQLSKHRSNLVNAELQGKTSKVNSLNKQISKAKDEIAELSERIKSYESAKKYKVEAETKEELFNIYQDFNQKRKKYQKLSIVKKEQLEKIKKQIKEKIEITKKEVHYLRSNDVIDNLSRIEHLIHDNGRVDMISHDRDSMYKAWLKGNENYKNYLDDYVK